MTRLQTIVRALALSAAFAVFGATACWAQIGGGPIGGGNGIGPVVSPADAQSQSKQAPRRELPPALPGAKSDPGQVAPASKSPSEMNPTDALFDAINRGDITVARDAINRGADLDGHNVLGMTPMELSVDLGRNDITFMLLSLRGGDSGSSGPPPTTKTAKGAAQKPIREVLMRQPAAPKVTAPPPPRVAKLFSGDGGTPAPQAGFLGFSGTATASSGN